MFTVHTHGADHIDDNNGDDHAVVNNLELYVSQAQQKKEKIKGEYDVLYFIKS